MDLMKENVDKFFKELTITEVQEENSKLEAEIEILKKQYAKLAKVRDELLKYYAPRSRILKRKRGN